MSYDKYRELNNARKFPSQHLSKQASTRIKTSFIFAIAEIEEVFGHLWGINKEEGEELTAEEEKWEDIFENLRKKILDNGNNQIRAMQRDIGFTLGDNGNG